MSHYVCVCYVTNHPRSLRVNTVTILFAPDSVLILCLLLLLLVLPLLAPLGWRVQDGLGAGCQLGCFPWWSRGGKRRSRAGGRKEGPLRSCMLSLLHSGDQSQVTGPPGSRRREADPPLHGRCCREFVAALNLSQFDESDKSTNFKKLPYV